MQKIISSQDICADLQAQLHQLPHDKLFVLTDKHTHRHCLPLLADGLQLVDNQIIVVEAGDEHKNLDTLAQVWQSLCEGGATRHSLLVNLGGGMLTDLGGFAAATFKRGIRFINIPTTLLGAVDAAVGGKTGVNFLHFKNEIGAFAPAEAVLIHTPFFRTLTNEALLSGYAEMLKHALIDNQQEWVKVLRFDVQASDFQELQELLITSVKVKERIVSDDPFEQNIRKALNLGHTIGHAFESISMELGVPVAHGYAVAWGLMCELYLSCKLCGFPKDKLLITNAFIKQNYGAYHFGCGNYERLFEYMRHDKKNASANEINFTLLADVGQVKINQTASKQDIFESIDFMRESFGM